jgi:hypothetical protein
MKITNYFKPKQTVIDLAGPPATVLPIVPASVAIASPCAVPLCYNSNGLNHVTSIGSSSTGTENVLVPVVIVVIGSGTKAVVKLHLLFFNHRGRRYSASDKLLAFNRIAAWNTSIRSAALRLHLDFPLLFKGISESTIRYWMSNPDRGCQVAPVALDPVKAGRKKHALYDFATEDKKKHAR